MSMDGHLVSHQRSSSLRSRPLGSVCWRGESSSQAEVIASCALWALPEDRDAVVLSSWGTAVCRLCAGTIQVAYSWEAGLTHPSAGSFMVRPYSERLYFFML